MLTIRVVLCSRASHSPGVYLPIERKWEGTISIIKLQSFTQPYTVTLWPCNLLLNHNIWLYCPHSSPELFHRTGSNKSIKRKWNSTIPQFQLPHIPTLRLCHWVLLQLVTQIWTEFGRNFLVAKFYSCHNISKHPQPRIESREIICNPKNDTAELFLTCFQGCFLLLRSSWTN